jgi:hypothetical protein
MSNSIEELHTVLDAMADEVLETAERLIAVGEKLNQIVKSADESAWLDDAQAELDALIESVEAG